MSQTGTFKGMKNGDLVFFMFNGNKLKSRVKMDIPSRSYVIVNYPSSGTVVDKSNYISHKPAKAN